MTPRPTDPQSEKRRRLRVLGVFWICVLGVVPAVLMFGGSVMVGHRAENAKQTILAYLHTHDVPAVRAAQFRLITGGRVPGDPLPGDSEVSGFGDGGVRLREEVRWLIAVRCVEGTETASGDIQAAVQSGECRG